MIKLYNNRFYEEEDEEEVKITNSGGQQETNNTNNNIQTIISTNINLTENLRVMLARFYYNSIFWPKKNYIDQDYNTFPNVLLKLYAIYKSPHIFVDGVNPQRRLDKIPRGILHKNYRLSTVNLFPAAKFITNVGDEIRQELERKKRGFATYYRLKEIISSQNTPLKLDIYDKMQLLKDNHNKYTYKLRGLKHFQNMVDVTIFYKHKLKKESLLAYSWSFPTCYEFK